jgi:hypothetical protein
MRRRQVPSTHHFEKESSAVQESSRVLAVPREKWHVLVHHVHSDTFKEKVYLESFSFDYPLGQLDNLFPNIYYLFRMQQGISTSSSQILPHFIHFAGETHQKSRD